MKIILIGSSPVMLLEAILLSKKYNDIEIHEKSNTFGGSWKTTSFYGKKCIETGSHIFAPWKNRSLYEQSHNILKSKFKLKTYYLKPQPSNIVNHNINKKEKLKIQYFYIKGGSQEILNSLYKLIKKLKIKILFNSYIRKITLEKNKKKIYSNRKIFYADHVYLPHYCKFNFNQKKTYQRRKSIHILLEYLNLKKNINKISYVQKVNFSKLFDRVSCFSNMLNFKNNIFCLRLNKTGKKKLRKNKSELIKKVSFDLMNFLYKKLDNKKFKVRYKLHYYETNFREKEELRLLKNFTKKNKCKLVNTSELIKYISQNLNRLKII